MNHTLQQNTNATTSRWTMSNLLEAGQSLEEHYSSRELYYVSGQFKLHIEYPNHKSSFLTQRPVSKIIFFFLGTSFPAQLLINHFE